MYLFWEEYLRFLNVQSSSRYSAETQGGAKFGTHVLFSFNSPFNVGEATPNTRGVAAQAGRGARRGDGGAVEEKRSPTRSPLLSHPASKGLVEAGRRTRSKMDGEVFSAHRPPFPRSRLHLRWRNARTFYFFPQPGWQAAPRKSGFLLRSAGGSAPVQTLPAPGGSCLPLPAPPIPPPKGHSPLRPRPKSRAGGEDAGGTSPDPDPDPDRDTGGSPGV